MTESDLAGYFEEFLKKEPLFINKKALQATYSPENVLHREEQTKQIAEILAPSLRLDKPSNLFIYGKTGTGKTCVAQHVSNQILDIAKQRDIGVKVVYINCKLKKIADTEYRLVAQLIREFGKEIPATGLPTDEVYKIFFNTVEKERQQIILILDEIDQLIKKAGDELLYSLTRINSELKESQISIIGISNDLIFADNLDPRVKSSLSEEELVFPPYNAMQIKDILIERSKISFRENVVEQGVLEKCAAYAAREHGDARRALELLRVAGEIAERKSSEKVVLKHIDEAEEKIEHDRMLDIVLTQPKQHQATLYSAIKIAESMKQSKIFTGEVYEVYKTVCVKTNLRPLTQRRVSDVISELDMLGIINAKVISKGRYGRTREISLTIPNSTIAQIKKILEEGLALS